MINSETRLIVVMGVSGCGKSTIGAALSVRTGLPFFDGDDFHPDSNRRRMSDGIPLNDADREPWLQAIVDFSANQCSSGKGLIVACSALKKLYRDQLRTLIWPVTFIYLQGSFDVIHQRMVQRSDHYMPTSLLESQFETLELPGGESGVIEISIDQSIESATNQIMKALETA